MVIDGKSNGQRFSVSLDDMLFSLFDILHKGDGRSRVREFISQGNTDSSTVRRLVLAEVAKPPLVKQYNYIAGVTDAKKSLQDLYNLGRGENSSITDFKQMLAWMDENKIAESTDTDIDKANDINGNIIKKWSLHQDKIISVSRSLVMGNMEGHNVTEAAAKLKFRSGELIAAAPDSAHRIQVIYKGGIKSGFIKTVAGSLKIYKSDDECWKRIAIFRGYES